MVTPASPVTKADVTKTTVRKGLLQSAFAVAEISTPVYEPARDDIMQCTICGRKADVLNTGRGPLVCCGKPMQLIKED